MKICFVGLENLPVLSPKFGQYGIGGEQVQHTLLARALVRRTHTVSMVVYDYGQVEAACWHGITTHKAYRRDAGIPVFRFIYPRWSGLWAALYRADADVYYVSCAGMQLGLVALFCRRHRRKLVFRVAHDTDCDPDQLLISYWRDKKLYEYGLRHANGILVQSVKQQQALLKNYGLRSEVAEMMVDAPEKPVGRDTDVLWVNNLRHFKRPDLLLALAKKLPQLQFHMVGGPQPGFDRLFEDIRRDAAQLSNLTFHGQLPYHAMDEKYARARVFVNTSDSEGFPNSYLQAWIRGTPVVAFFDPDNVIRKHHLGFAASSLDDMANAVRKLVINPAAWSEVSTRCLIYMARSYGENRILEPYSNLFQRIR